jgi:hypothetical protein
MQGGSISLYPENGLVRAERVNETMLDMGVPETMPGYTSVDFKPVFEEAYQNGGCKITCNGKPAWFKGKFPCFGKLAVRLPLHLLIIMLLQITK